jgi:pimeloyl-ACP methyl ester carboxylesterase
VVVLACGYVNLGVNQLLDGAAAEEAAGLAFGGQDVGAAPDAELRCPRPRQPDAVRDADLMVGGEVDRDWLADVAGCRAEAACGDDPDGLAAGPAPTQIVAGRNDELVPWSNNQYLDQLLPSTTTEICDDARCGCSN